MKLCRFLDHSGTCRPGLYVDSDSVLDLSAAGIDQLSSLFLRSDRLEYLADVSRRALPRFSLSSVTLLPPVDRQEVWAAGVTYLRSKKARMEESDFSASAYDRVYEAARPELFFKGLAEKVVGPGSAVGIRQDARWSVPEPEFALVVNPVGKIVGFTIGNDMSSRDIEGENLLYLPQAKIYNRSCALGPVIVVGVTEEEARRWKIRLRIQRQQTTIFTGETGVGQIKRSFEELVSYLFRSQSFPHGAILLTGTGIVPPDSFTLQPDDLVLIEVDGVGSLSNPVLRV